MARKARTRKDRKLDELESVVLANADAKRHGPKPKTWTLHDLKSIKPITYTQRQMFEAYFEDKNILATGSAGTGKSFCALYLALTDLLKEKSTYDHIIIVRSPTSVKDVGFLPGTYEEKLAPYEAPYREIINNLLRKSEAYDSLKEMDKLRFLATTYVRGLTWDNAIVILDEVQNCQFHEINSVVTRLGDNSKLIICGDLAQNDLVYNRSQTSGFARAMKVFDKMGGVEHVFFTRDDIVRSALIKAWICAVEDTPE
jgi:phosphate starvation-inducible protein PhoH